MAVESIFVYVPLTGSETDPDVPVVRSRTATKIPEAAVVVNVAEAAVAVVVLFQTPRLTTVPEGIWNASVVSDALAASITLSERGTLALGASVADAASLTLSDQTVGGVAIVKTSAGVNARL